MTPLPLSPPPPPPKLLVLNDYESSATRYFTPSTLVVGIHSRVSLQHVRTPDENNISFDSWHLFQKHNVLGKKNNVLRKVHHPEIIKTIKTTSRRRDLRAVYYFFKLYTLRRHDDLDVFE